MRNALLIVMLAIPFWVMGQQFPERSDRLVNDYAGVLSPTEVQQLEQKLEAYARESSVQIAIVILRTLDGYPIDDYAFELGERWGIGQKGSDNGALILVSMDERKMWIATGYGLESTVTDALAKRIIENEMKPRFRQGDFAGGLLAAADAIIQATKGEYQGGGNGEEDRPGPAVLLVVGVIVLFWTVFWGIAAMEARKYARINGVSFWTAWALLNASRRNHGGSWSGFSGGGGGFSSGGGGFGGFGGGSFGGGGAGGSW